MAISVNSGKTNLLNSVAAAVLVLPFWASASFAQETQAQSQEVGDSGQAATGQQGQEGQGTASDTLVATVGEAEIRNSDLMRAIGALPPPLSSQPPEMLISTALQQLVLREAIVQEARSQGLAEDPEVQSLVEGATQAAQEDALVQVWLQRELANRVTPEAVDAAYAGLQAVATGEVPPLDQIRPQIEQSLAQQAINDIGGTLLLDTQVTVYGPDGQPLDPQSGEAGGQANAGDQSGDTASAQAAAQTQPEEAGAGTTLMVADSQEHGQHLVDGEGRAVYGFTADEQGEGDGTSAVSNCYDACAEAWPPVLANDQMPTTGEMAMPNLLGATLRADGSMQVTYNGWPLYHFVQDQGPGQATGQDVQAHGGEWHLLRPTGEMVEQE